MSEMQHPKYVVGVHGESECFFITDYDELCAHVRDMLLENDIVDKDIIVYELGNHVRVESTFKINLVG